MANDYASQFEQARKNYREQLDTYRSSHKEEDLVKANEAYQAWPTPAGFSSGMFLALCVVSRCVAMVENT